jgi:hypothetical protein
MLVAEFAAKYDRLADLNLTKSALYALASNEYPENVIDAVINRGAPELITESVLDDVNELLNEVLNAKPEDQESGEQEEDDQEEEQSVDEAEAEAILDGEPPDVPPTPELLPPTDYKLARFDEAIGTLKELYTSSIRRFVCTEHSASDLTRLSEFLLNLGQLIRDNKREAA